MKKGLINKDLNYKNFQLNFKLKLNQTNRHEFLTETKNSKKTSIQHKIHFKQIP